MLGNGLLWIGGLGAGKEFKEVARRAGIEIKESRANRFPDEVESGLKKVKSVPWSTITINHDAVKVTSYHQRVGLSHGIADTSGRLIPDKTGQGTTGQRVWKPKEVIHSRFMQLDGKVYGYTPTFSILPEISTLQLLKDYNGYFFENSGLPDWMFILPHEMANSDHVKALEQSLKDFKGVKRGNLVFTGEVNPLKLNTMKDMQFRQLAVYYSAVMAFSFGMPAGRMSTILKLELKGKGEDDLADSSYWRQISSGQDYHETLFNTQLFNPFFNVNIRFNRSYKQDEIREVQREMFAADAGMKMIELFSQYGKRPTLELLQRTFKLKDGELESAPAPPPMPVGARQGFMPDQKLLGNEQLSVQKRMEQGKVADRTQLQTGKEIKEMELPPVQFDLFKEVIDFYRIRFDDSPLSRPYYIDNGDHYVVYFSTHDWRYKTKVPKKGLSKHDEMSYIKYGYKLK